MSKLTKYSIAIKHIHTEESYEGIRYAINPVVAAFLFIVDETEIWYDEDVDRENYTLEELEYEFDMYDIQVLKAK